MTTDAASLPEVVGDAGDVVPVGDVDALAGALCRLVEDDAHRSARSAAGAVRSRDFTWAASAERHRVAYEAALS